MFLTPLSLLKHAGMHPMTQLSSAILAMQTESVFASEYSKGTHKSLYWEHAYEDILNLLARLPEVQLPSPPTTTP